ncbi:MAG: hypothetical protein Ct9H300mP11_32700 [Chloroflexota bacterium]|nr:MAG: hypothetical protein Ct9H300mP11_32700 [Chloroflexota bacterium]
MEDERAFVLNLNHLSEIFQAFFDIYIWAAGVGEDQDSSIQVEVDAGWLDSSGSRGEMTIRPFASSSLMGLVA